jgi:hypothetical protein
VAETEPLVLLFVISCLVGTPGTLRQQPHKQIYDRFLSGSHGFQFGCGACFVFDSIRDS